MHFQASTLLITLSTPFAILSSTLVRSIPHRLVLTQWATVKLSVILEKTHWQKAANALHYDQNSNESVHQQAQTSSRTTTQNHLEGPS
jgi:hypothetical protein